MHHAKGRSKAGADVPDPTLGGGVSKRRKLTRSLRKAVERHELRLQYQPIVRFSDGVVAGLEALVRWHAPGRQRRMPEDFIGISEESGSIVTIGRWVLEAACHQARTWQLSSGRDDLSVTVNLSARQFQDRMLGRTVADAVSAAGLPPSSLILEITESVLMQQTQRTLDVLGELRDGGVRVAIDDFGTGYSSLSYLRRFPIDVLKIDRAFVNDSTTDQGAVLARAIVDIGTGLGMQVIAEGIEREQELRLMRSFGCDYGQGYLFSTPMDAADVLACITEGAVSLILPRASEHVAVGAVA